MGFKYNEKLYAETIYSNGFQTDYIKSELTILVKYLKQVKNLKKKETEDFLYQFCEKHIEGFNKVKYFKAIDSAINKGRKKDNNLLVIEKIPLYKEELECIDKLEINHEYKKMLLVFLVNKKINLEIRRLNDNSTNEMSAYFEANKKKYNDLFKTANITEKVKIDQMIYELVNRNIIDSIINGGIVLKYMYPIYETRTEVADRNGEEKKKITIIYDVKNYELYEEITDFENIGYVFDYYKGVNSVKKCECCGIYIKKSSKKPPKYCKECAIKVNKDKTLERWKRLNF